MDLESFYNGDVQTIADISNDDPNKKSIELDKIDLFYPSGATDDGRIIMKDVGTYTVTAKIKDALKNDGLTFKGGTGTETEVTFNFTIKKKQIECKITSTKDEDSNRYIYTVTPKDDSEANKIYDTDTGDRAPTFTITYQNTQTGATSTEYPTAIGTYKVAATMNSNINYEMKGTCEAAQPLEITATPVTDPSLSPASLTYNGGLQDITINGWSADVKIDSIKKDNVKVEYQNGVLEFEDGKLKIKDAGVYEVTFALVNKNTTVWSTRKNTDNYSLSVTINPKALTVDISCSETGNSWNYGDQPTVTITENSYTDDTIELKVYYVNNTSPSTKYEEINTTKVVTGKTTTITMPANIAKGNYTIHVEKTAASSSNSNGNYSYTTKTLVFTVNGIAVTLQDDDIDWLCNSISIGYPTNYSVPYTGSPYTFSIDDSVLASCGVKIDVNKSGTTNGYSGTISATNASGTTAYTVTVHLTNLNDTYADYTKTYELNYRIDKAKYNLTGLSWPSNNQLEYNGAGQEVKLIGILPAGLNATYTGDLSKTPVGNYTTNVTFTITPDYANNYILPVATDKTSYIGDDFKFSFAWEIIQATISVSWKNDNNGNVTQYTWPTLNNLPQANMIDYTYYDKNDNQVYTLPNPDEVTEETTYKVVATLKTAYKNNYKLSTGNTAEYTFVIGKDKFVVKLTLQWNNADIQGKQLPYTGSAYTPTIEILQADGGVGAQDITLKYYKNGAVSPITGEPTEVGNYRIEVVLSDAKAEDNYIDSACAEFTFEIIKADFDVSGLKWQYTHGSVTATYDFDQSKWLDANGDEISPMTYDKTAHTLTLVGKDSISDDLTISVVGNEETNANSNYTAKITFSYDTDNYNAPNFPTNLSWSIAKAKVDASAIKWGYVIGDGEETEYTGALPYARVNGKEAAYTVGLINVPEILKDYISYTGGERTQSKKGDYSIQYVLADLGSNYESVVMPSSLQTKLNWSISVKILPTPVFDKSWTEFDGEIHDFAQMFGITEEGWENYMTITITKDGNAYDGLDGEAYKAIKAGEYTVTFDLVDYDNIDWQDGVWPAASTQVRVKAYEINLQWQGNNTNSTAVLEDWVKSYVDYRYKDGEGNILANGIRDMETGVPYYKELYAKDGYENDIKIYGDPRTVLRPGSSASVVKPVFDTNKKVTYNGNSHSIEEFLRSGDEMPAGVKIDVLDGSLTDAGELTIRISLEDDEIFTWEDGSTDSYTVTLNIEKATIAQNRLEWTTDEGGLPKLKVKGHSEIEFTYTYYDEDGYELTLEDIADGMEYTKVVARLDNGNYAMVDATNTIVEEVTYSPNEDDNKDPNSGDQSGENPPPSNNEGGGLFGGSLEEIMAKLKEIPLWQLVASIISMILIIVFLSKTAKYDSERKKFNKKASKLESMYAGAFLGVAMSIWTAIACVLIAMAVVSFVMMMIAKSRRNKAEEEYEDHLDEYNRNKADFDEKKRDENMRMMLMGMMGGNAGGAGPQGGFAYQQGLTADDMRGLISETVTAMLPGMQQMLPQQASTNDEVVQKLIEQNEKLMQQLAEKPTTETANNDAFVQKLMEQNAQAEKRVEKLMQQIVDRPAEREVASANISDETLERLVNKLQPTSTSDTILKVVEKTEHNDETIKQLLKNQEVLMEKIIELSDRKPEEKIVEKEVPVEKIVEKVVEVPVEKIVEKEVIKEVPIEVEKIVEKEVIKEVPIEVEKVVEKLVEVPVEKVVEKVVEKEVNVAVASKPKKEIAPKLTLDEAYAELSKQQQKYFDGLRDYALSKDKCKEKKSTYFIVFGPNTANPLLKLTIKKDTVVALYKMEDEYMKDLRRNATSDGSKIKVKETELVVADAQAFKTAKEMIDLREDQIERYDDFLKEQKAMSKRR